MLRILLTTLVLSGAAYALEPAQLLKNTSPSMVLVRALGDDERLIRTGGGIVVNRGKVLTNCHVLAKAKSLQVQYLDIIYRSTLEHADVERDLCQLDVSKLPAPAVTVGGVQTVRLGQPVHALTMSLTGELFLVDSRVLALREFQSTPIVEIQANVPQPAGAAAIVDDDGRLIGVTTLMVKDTPDATSAILADALMEIPQRSRQALERQRKAALAKTPSSAITSYAAEWAPRIALLEKSQDGLTLSRAIAILLDISAQEDLDLLLKHDEMIKALIWHSAYAIGTDDHGNIIWGGSRDWRNRTFAIETAAEYCAGNIASSCKVIMVNGEFLEKDFIDVAKKLGAQNVATTRQSYLQSLNQTPTESRVRYNAGGGGGGPSYGFASAR